MTTSLDWTGRVGDVWAREWRRTDRTFAELSCHLDAEILALAPQAGTVLDIGCGAGGTSLALAAAHPALAITGIDLSEGLVAVARERAGDTPNVRFEVADAAAPPPSADPAGHAFAVSRHGVMFFADPVVAFAAIRRTLAPRAPLIFSCFRAVESNPWACDVAAAVGASIEGGEAPGPFAFADRARVAVILAAAGWRDATATAVDFAYHAGAGDDPVEDALDLFSRIGPAARTLAGLDQAERPARLIALRAVLATRLRYGAVDFPAAAWIWTARA